LESRTSRPAASTIVNSPLATKGERKGCGRAR
jgi:hypothetical protein